MKKILALIVLLSGGLVSCSVEPEPINYGFDACNFCEMTIVSKAHAARSVSEKGKQFKYDAIECMIHDELRHEIPKSIIQVSNLSQPGNMIAVNEAVFVINDSINSPMGANLGAIEENLDTGKNAELYSWEELISRFEQQETMSTNF